MAEIFKWKNHSFKADTTKVNEEINTIGSEVKPIDIVEYAKLNPESELHKCFTWDNDVAAEKWRLQEARFIICNLVKVETNEDNKPVTEPLRVYFRTETKGGYKPTEMILQNKDEYISLLQMAKNELYAFQKKYNNLCELEEVFIAINNL